MSIHLAAEGRVGGEELRAVVLSELGNGLASPGAGLKVSSWGFSCLRGHSLQGIPYILKLEFQRLGILKEKQPDE